MPRSPSEYAVSFEEYIRTGNAAVCQAVGRAAKIQKTDSEFLIYLKDFTILWSDQTGQSQLTQYIDTSQKQIQYAPRYQLLVTVRKDDLSSTQGELHAGDYILLHGEISLPELPVNPGQFNYRTYCLARNILYLMKSVHLDGITSQKSIAGTLEYVRDVLKNSLQMSMSEHDAGILQAMLLGDKSSIDSETKALYADSGISHILAISGLHISLIGMGIWRILRKCRLPYPLTSLVSAGTVLLYSYMTGMSLSALRASIMFLLWCLGQSLGRTPDPLTQTAVAAIISLLYYPFAVLDSSFYLSYGCILSLHLLTPVLSWLLKQKKWLQPICAGAAIWIGTLPVMCYDYYQITPYSPFINLLILPLTGILAAAGALSAAAGIISPLLGAIAAGPAHYILAFYETICQMVRLLPFHIVITGRPSDAAIIGYYVLLFFMLCLVKQFCSQHQHRNYRIIRKRQKSLLTKKTSAFTVKAMVVIILLTGCGLMLCKDQPDFQIVFFDVGQGDCILIRNEGKTYINDCGSSSVSEVWKKRISTSLKYYGISKIDAILLSHGDHDHISGIEELIEDSYQCMGRNMSDGIVVSKICASSVTLQTDEKLKEVKAKADAYAFETEALPCNMQIRNGPFSMQILYPSDTDEDPDQTNEQSMVLLVSFGDFSALLTGDLEKKGEASFCKNILRSDDFKTYMTNERLTVLKCGHHGSRYASTDELLQLLNPEYAVISCALNNRYGHPAQEVLERLHDCQAGVLRTDKMGAIEITVTDDICHIMYYSSD